MKTLLRLVPALLLAGTCFTLTTATSAALASPVWVGYAQDRWDLPPGEFGDMERRGFHDGIEGARHDFGNHRRPDVNNRDEFRHPHVPDRDRDAYRRGFERGYHVGVEHFYRDHY